jgi:DNA-binding MarR family transcriptional regulator
MQLHATSKSGPSAEVLRPLLQSFGAMMRTTARLKQQFAAAGGNDIEWSGHFLISVLLNEGPMRGGSLAECVQVDQSTASRQIAGLIKAGLLERQIDPDDGRASLLAVTEVGRAKHEEHLQMRLSRFQVMLADWSEDECRQFQGFLDRFSGALDQRRALLAPGGVRVPPTDTETQSQEGK